MNDRTSRVVAVLAVGSLLLAACGTGDTEEIDAGGEQEEAADPQRGGTIVVGVDSESVSRDPVDGLIGFAGRIINQGIYATPTAATPEGVHLPYMLESLESNDDATVWTFTLKEGMVFHDGTPIDAGAVKFNMDRASDPETAIGPLYEWVESIEVVDDMTVQVAASESVATFPAYFTTEWGLLASPTAVQELGDDFAVQPVGAGPYRFVEWVRDSHFTMERFDDFLNDEYPFADVIRVEPIPEDSARVAALLADDIDVMFTDSASTVAQLREESGIDLIEIPYGARSLTFNNESEHLSDLRVRMAIAHAIDKQTLIDTVWSGVGVPTNSEFDPESPFYAQTETPEFDNQAANSIMEEYLDETGLDEVTLRITGPPGSVEQSLLEALQAMLGGIDGLTIDIDAATDQNIYVQRLIDGDFELATGFAHGFDDPEFRMTTRWRSDSFLNFANFFDEELDEALRIGRGSTDQDERIAAYQQVQEILSAELPLVYIASGVIGVAHQPDIGGAYDSWFFPDGTKGQGQLWLTPIHVDTIYRTDE